MLVSSGFKSCGVTGRTDCEAFNEAEEVLERLRFGIAFYTIRGEEETDTRDCPMSNGRSHHGSLSRRSRSSSSPSPSMKTLLQHSVEVGQPETGEGGEGRPRFVLVHEPEKSEASVGQALKGGACR